jgi:hypothetical protein
MNTDELRTALADQERFAPHGQAVVDDLTALLRLRRRRPHWGSGLLAAAAVVGIVAATTTLLHPAAPAPDRSTTASTSTADATATSTPPPTAVASTPHPLPTPTSPSTDSSQAALQAQAQRQAEQAASSAEAAANTSAAAGATAAAQCNDAARSHPIDTKTTITSTTIRPVVDGCEKAWGAAAGYTVEWVQTTVGKLHTLSTGELSRDPQPVVAIQIHAVFTKGGQSGPAETMLIHLRNGSPPGVDVPTNPLNLAVLGDVHHW